jgi:hypothetical protein
MFGALGHGMGARSASTFSATSGTRKPSVSTSTLQPSSPSSWSSTRARLHPTKAAASIYHLQRGSHSQRTSRLRWQPHRRRRHSSELPTRSPRSCERRMWACVIRRKKRTSPVWETLLCNALLEFVPHRSSHRAVARTPLPIRNPPGSADRNHQFTRDNCWTSPSLRPGLGFWYTSRFFRSLTRFIEAISAAPKNVDERSSKCRLF